MSRPAILDVDTGIDDALAIVMAASSPELELVAVTAVAGNVPLEKTSRNSAAVLHLIGRDDVPVYPGAVKPLVDELRTAEWVHGEDGLAGLGLGGGRVEKERAANAIVRLAREYGGLVVITTGPLTNLAVALSLDPELVDLVEAHYMMGGAYGLTPYGYGNATPTAEFNIWQDPEAALIVLGSGLNTYAVGLDVTMDPGAALSLEDAEWFHEKGCSACELAYRVSKFYIERVGDPLMRLHDPMAVAAAVEPRLFAFEEHPVEVALCGKARGTTLVERRPWVKKPGIKIAVRVDGEGFKRLFAERVAGSPP